MIIRMRNCVFPYFSTKIFCGYSKELGTQNTFKMIDKKISTILFSNNYRDL